MRYAGAPKVVEQVRLSLSGIQDHYRIDVLLDVLGREHRPVALVCVMQLHLE
jgi:hypothetical protein